MMAYYCRNGVQISYSKLKYKYFWLTSNNGAMKAIVDKKCYNNYKPLSLKDSLKHK